MTLVEVQGYIEQAKQAGMRGVSITGGEPFLDFELLRGALETVGELGLRARIVTNSFWAATPDRAISKLTELKKHGLTEISLSYDAMHASYVKRSAVENAFRAATDLGLKVVVSHVADNGDLNKSLDSALLEIAAKKDEVTLAMAGYTVPSGRALENRTESSYSYASIKESHNRLSAPCFQVTREPIVVPGGDVFPCCSPSTATDVGFRDAYKVGNLGQDSLRRILDQLEADPLFNAIMIHGPKWVYERTSAVSNSDTDKFINICDLCQHMLKTRSDRERLTAELATQGAKLVVTKHMMQSMANGDVDRELLYRRNLSALRPHK